MNKLNKLSFFTFITIISLLLTSNTGNATEITTTSKKAVVSGEKILLKCKNESQAPYTCTTGELLKILKSEGIESMLMTFKYISEKTNGINGACNNIGRELGRESYKVFKNKALNYHASICGPSYAYGVMIEFGKSSPKDAGGALLKKYCYDDGNPTACAYGLGISMSESPRKGREVMNICDKAFSSIKNEQDNLYEHSATGLCVLGWVSGKVSTLPSSEFSTISKASALCEGMSNPALESCVGEATFAYTYVGQNTTADRLKKVNDLKKYCNNKSKVCMQFIGKAFNDFLLYAYRPNYSNNKDINFVSSNLTNLCKGNFHESCIYGFISAQLTHTSMDESSLVCSKQSGYVRNDCSNILSKIGKAP